MNEGSHKQAVKLGIIVFLALVIGGIYYYFAIYRPEHTEIKLTPNERQAALDALSPKNAPPSNGGAPVPTPEEKKSLDSLSPKSSKPTQTGATTDNKATLESLQ